MVPEGVDRLFRILRTSKQQVNGEALATIASLYVVQISVARTGAPHNVRPKNPPMQSLGFLSAAAAAEETETKDTNRRTTAVFRTKD